MRVLILLFFFLGSCTNPPYRGLGVCGAEDFVLDSYQIREGKFALLEMQGECVPPFDPTFLEEQSDSIKEGDLLQIILHHPTRSDRVNSLARVGSGSGFPVLEGKVFLPDIEPIEVVGLSLLEAKSKIERVYRRDIQDMEVFLCYQERDRDKVELIGLVGSSLVPVNGKIRLFEVLAKGKVAPNANLFKSYVVRDGCILPVDLFRLIKEGDMCQNIVMQGGDKIYIADPADSSLMVLGEVNKQRVIPLPNGFMTLRQALAEAGGIPITGDKRYIQVVRGNLVHPRIYTLTWEHIVRLPNNSLLLIPGDIVYVAATPIAQWDRFVNQILPTLIGLDIVSRGVKNVGITLP